MGFIICRRKYCQTIQTSGTSRLSWSAVVFDPNVHVTTLPGASWAPERIRLKLNVTDSSEARASMLSFKSSWSEESVKLTVLWNLKNLKIASSKSPSVYVFNCTSVKHIFWPYTRINQQRCYRCFFLCLSTVFRLPSWTTKQLFSLGHFHILFIISPLPLLPSLNPVSLSR